MNNTAATPPGGGYRALVVDDEIPAAEALELAREIDPDVVILDLALSGIDGLEVCRQRRPFSDTYVVMLTARDTEVDTIVGLSVGADDYVTKPFSPRKRRQSQALRWIYSEGLVADRGIYEVLLQQGADAS